ncbi:MAG TPA: hypothetical protein VFJ14_03135, partial [Nocardioidaceae bacterium]|nr:hypothetical protein [Nocardioidaceae bacterium]
EVYLPSAPGGSGSGSAPTLDGVPTGGRSGEKVAEKQQGTARPDERPNPRAAQDPRSNERKPSPGPPTAPSTEEDEPPTDNVPPPAPPKPPTFIPADGTLTTCDDSDNGTWCIDGAPYDFGPADHVKTMQASDYDGSGEIEPILNELEGLAGHHITAEVRNNGDKTAIHTVQGLAYRDADGALLGSVAPEPSPPPEERADNQGPSTDGQETNQDNTEDTDQQTDPDTNTNTNTDTADDTGTDTTGTDTTGGTGTDGTGGTGTDTRDDTDHQTETETDQQTDAETGQEGAAETADDASTS